MEFLNNLWIAMSTTNDGLINVILFFAGFVEAFLTMKLFLSMFNIRATKKSKTIFIMSISLLLNFGRYFIPTPFNMFFNYIATFLLIKFIFKAKSSQSIISTASSYIICGLIGFLILKPLLYITKFSYEQVENIPIIHFVYLLIIYTINLIIIEVIKKHSSKFFLVFDNLDRKNKTIIILNFILSLMTLCLHVFITFYYINTLPMLFNVLSFISLSAYFIISIYTLIKANELFKLTEDLHTVEEYNKTLQLLHDSVRGFKHDFDNIVTAIGGYIQTDDMEGLKKYYSHLQTECQMSNNLYLLNPNIVNNPAIYSLLTNKYYRAEKENININFSFLLDFTKLNMNIYEFTRALGILLDNAIEAASESTEKIINVVFKNEEKNHRQIVLIENSYKDVVINLDKIFDKGVSGKENHTGLGLWEVRKILRKNNNLNLYTNPKGKYFTQQLEIYY